MSRCLLFKKAYKEKLHGPLTSSYKALGLVLQASRFESLLGAVSRIPLFLTKIKSLESWIPQNCFWGNR